MPIKYRTQFYKVQGTRLSAGDVLEYYGVSIDDLLSLHLGETQTFIVGGYEVTVQRL